MSAGRWAELIGQWFPEITVAGCSRTSGQLAALLTVEGLHRYFIDMDVSANEISGSASSACSGYDQYEVEILHDARIPTADPQVTLSADIWLPVGTDPVPSLVMMLPYRNDIVGSYHACMRWFAERGYACLLANVRGTGSSDGIQRPPLDPGEGDDLVAVIEWAASQPWCTGDVGVWGGSYGGTTTMRAASRRPAQLKAIIPMMFPFDLEWDWYHPNGARGDLRTRAYWGGMMLAYQLLPPLLNYASVEEQARWQRRLHDTEPYLMDLARHGAGDEVWRDRVIDVASVTTATLCIGGWRDGFVDPVVRAYEQIQGPKKLLIGPWGHVLPHNSPVEPIDFPSIALRWWDYWLRGVDNGVMDEPPVTLYLPGDSVGWRGFESWPPTKDELVLATGTDTRLSESTSDEILPVGVIAAYEPDPTTGLLGGPMGIVSPPIGLPLDDHEDVGGVWATSDPLSAGVLVCGRPTVTVRLVHDDFASPDAPQRLVVRLVEVDPDGRATLVAVGVLCPNEPRETYRIALNPTAWTVRAGQRLRVVLSDSDFPLLTPLTHPSPISVASIQLAAPILPEEAGTVVEMPAIGKPAASKLLSGAAELAGEIQYTLTYDPIRDGKEVAFRTNSPRAPAYQGHSLETHSGIRAAVQRVRPDESTVNAHHTLVAHMNNEEIITVTATVRCSQTTLLARGDVEIDGTTVFSRTWQSLLGDANGHR